MKPKTVTTGQVRTRVCLRGSLATTSHQRVNRCSRSRVPWRKSKSLREGPGSCSRLDPVPECHLPRMRKAGLCVLRSRPPVQRSHDVSRPSGAFGRMLGPASRSTAHARPICNGAPSLHRENREIPLGNSGGTWRGRVACPWSTRSDHFVFEANADPLMRVYFEFEKS
jgi:hypothetical protein